MRFVPALLLVCICLRAQDAAPVKQGGIAGIAIDAITHQPMAGVHVTLRTPGAHGNPAEDSNAYGAISQPDGHYSISSMKPGLYALEAQHNGYVYLPPKAANGRHDPTVAIKTGEQVKDFTVEMTPHAVIVGHVLDENGDPVQYVEVTTIPADQYHFTGDSGWALTDDRGQFRFALPPGKFYIQANANRGPIFGDAGYGPPEIRNDGLTPAIYGTVFYPAAASKDKATPVEITPGQELTGIDFHLVRRRSLTISGTISGIPSPLPADAFATVMLLSSGDSDSSHVSRELPARDDGKFMFPGLSPGRYRVLARVHSADAVSLQSPAVEVLLENGEVSGVRLELRRGETLSGAVEIEDGSTKRPPTEKLTVRLQSECGGDARKGADIDEKGAFHFDDVFPEKLGLKVVPIPENAYIKSVKLGTTEAPDDLLDLSHGVNAAHLNITVNRNGGRLEGTVESDEGQPPRTSVALVVLAPSADDLGDQRFRPVPPGERFLYTGLRPGKYRLFAFDAGEVAGDQSRLKDMFLKAPEIEIREGDRITKNIRVSAVNNAKP